MRNFNTNRVELSYGFDVEMMALRILRVGIPARLDARPPRFLHKWTLAIF